MPSSQVTHKLENIQGKHLMSTSGLHMLMHTQTCHTHAGGPKRMQPQAQADHIHICPNGELVILFNMQKLIAAPAYNHFSINYFIIYI